MRSTPALMPWRQNRATAAELETASLTLPLLVVELSALRSAATTDVEWPSPQPAAIEAIARAARRGGPSAEPSKSRRTGRDPGGWPVVRREEFGGLRE